MSKAVSVIIATHNYGHWLADAVSSVTNEGYPNLNICIIDDGSTDDTPELVAHMAKKITQRPGGHQILSYRNEVPLGPSAARNLAIKQNWSQSDVFAILDADDMYRPGKLTKSIEKLYSDSNIGAVYTDYDILNMETGHLHREYKEPYSLEKLRHDCIIHSACVIKKEALDFAGLYREDMRTCEDYELWARISKRFVFWHIPEPLMLVRSGRHGSVNYRTQEEWNHNWAKVQQTFNQG